MDKKFLSYFIKPFFLRCSAESEIRIKDILNDITRQSYVITRNIVNDKHVYTLLDKDSHDKNAIAIVFDVDARNYITDIDVRNVIAA